MALIDHPRALMNTLCRIAVEAGSITLDYFDEGGITDADAKADGSPLTKADRAAEAHIEKALRDLVPDTPFVGEEAVAEGRTQDPAMIAAAPRLWMVDALDGTREFIKGSGEYTVNIALIEHGRPIIGVIYAPVLDQLYAGYGGKDGAAFKGSEAGLDEQRPIRVRAVPKDGLTIVASISHDKEYDRDRLLGGLKVAKVIKTGSSLKLCVIASGRADLYPRMGPTSFWDIAAGDAILTAAGGAIVDHQLNPLTYCWNPKTAYLNCSFVACGDTAFAQAVWDAKGTMTG